MVMVVLGARPRRPQPTWATPPPPGSAGWTSAPPPPPQSGWAPPPPPPAAVAAAGGWSGPPGFSVYPVALEGHLDEPLSRWLWLVKWLLALPHYFVLALLSVPFVLLTLAAFVAILFTGHYPRAIFDFNLGVMRWAWRVSFYSYSALGTDRYPPFSLGEEPSYPARLEIAYPERLSRGLVLVKSWLLAIPHLIILALLLGGSWTVWHNTSNQVSWTGGWGGVIGLLVFVAGVLVLFTGRYPRGLFDLVMALNRWVYRVIAYIALMRDEYPPFRLDLGETEPDTTGPAPAAPPAPPMTQRPLGT
jgi:hypothetical protein